MAAMENCATIDSSGSSFDDMSNHASSRTYSIVVILSKYRLSLSKLCKPNNVRIFVVSPPRMLYDEANVDVYYQVELPMSETDHSPMLQKARELVQMVSTSQVRIVAFEKSLQRAVAKLRYELDVEGFNHEQIDLLSRIRESSQMTRRGGLTTPRQMILTGITQPEMWLEAVHSQLGGYPVYVRPARSSADYAKTIIGVQKLESDEETKQWFRRVYAPASPTAEWVIEESYEDGVEFVVMCTAVAGIIYCISAMDHDRTLFDLIANQKPYAVQLFNVDQTRDQMPGLESFVMQTTKTLFSKNFSGAIFIRGFYKTHNDIFLLGVELQPSSECHRNLLSLPKESPGWESICIHSLFAGDSSELDYTSSPPSVAHHAVINVPSQEGVLLHQATIHKRRTSSMRVSWRCAEGQELRDSDGIDGNIVQVFISNTENRRLVDDIGEIMKKIDIPIDRNPVVERHAACRKHYQRLNAREFVRSCTTTD